jgi:hypothetical protein
MDAGALPVVTRATVIGFFVLAAIGAGASTAYSHPLHTTLTELSVSSDGSVQIVIRAFVDDFSAAVTRRAAPGGAPIATPPDSATARYIGESVILTDGGGRRVTLAVANVRRTDDLLWITLRAAALTPVAGARLTNRLLFERWDDQVNIVQSSVGARRQTLLFTKREGSVAKAI